MQTVTMKDVRKKGTPKLDYGSEPETRWTPGAAGGTDTDSEVLARNSKE